MNAVIVTGASGGIGSQICEDLSRLGFEIIGVDKAPSKWTREKVYDLKDRNLPTCLASEYDLSGLKGIVHAAAEQVIGRLQFQDASVWNETLWTNIMALDLLVRKLGPHLVSNAGSVVLIGSVHAVASRSEVAIYAISKAAGEGWVRSAALEYAPDFRINSVIPGAIASGKFWEFIKTAGAEGEKLTSKISSRTPLKRIGLPEDVSAAVRFLLSDESSFITGQSIVVDGGATLLLATEVD